MNRQQKQHQLADNVKHVIYQLTRADGVDDSAYPLIANGVYRLLSVEGDDSIIVVHEEDFENWQNDEPNPDSDLQPDCGLQWVSYMRPGDFGGWEFILTEILSVTDLDKLYGRK